LEIIWLISDLLAAHEDLRRPGCIYGESITNVSGLLAARAAAGAPQIVYESCMCAARAQRATPCVTDAHFIFFSF
jgi:hypothetical protein